MATVFLTGATGFIGAHVLRALVEAGHVVRALVRDSPERLPTASGCTPVVGDLTRPGHLVRAMDGCEFLVHVAALYSFAPSRRRQVWATNVQGSRGLLEAARIAGIRRAVVTSSSATVGPARGGRPADETCHVAELEGSGRDAAPYHVSKALQERQALAARVPVVLILPTAPVGPGDWKPTPTGRVVLEFLRGRIVASVTGGMSLVSVEDVAQAHVLALERGQDGERYLVGGENLTFDRLWELLARVSGRPAPRLHIPHSAALTLAWADELRCRLTRGEPRVPLEGARMASQRMYVDSTRARRELGWRPSPVEPALARAVAWYRDHGYADR
jgi:dihydroflavonol-4-reductase